MVHLAVRGVDLTGRRFGMLTVIEKSDEVRTKSGSKKWKCLCDCGKYTYVRANHLLTGNIKSCGCNHFKAFVTHGHSDDRLYSVWQTMKARCRNPNNQKYKNYGGRGIKVCDEWMNSFQAFYDWAMANGYDYDAPIGKCTIDRIDVNGNYEPSNCRWVDAKTQAANMRKPPRPPQGGTPVTYKGKKYVSLASLSREYGFHEEKLYRRIHRMSIDEAMEEISRSKTRKKAV